MWEEAKLVTLKSDRVPVGVPRSVAPSASQETTNYNKADAILWQNMVTLPLYQKPQFWAWSNNLKGVLPNTSSVGVTWNAEDWSISG